MDPKRHEAMCDVVLTVQLHNKERKLDSLEQLIPFPGLEAFHQASISALHKEIDNLVRRLTRKDTPPRRKK